MYQEATVRSVKDMPQRAGPRSSLASDILCMGD
jgi:hypothetical protein